METSQSSPAAVPSENASEPVSTIPFQPLRTSLLFVLFLLCILVIPLDSTWWLIMRITTDVFIVCLSVGLLCPGIRVLLTQGLQTSAMIQVGIALFIWVTPMVFNVGSIYWHTSINYSFLQDSSSQVGYLNREKTDENMVIMIKSELRGRWEALSSFRDNLLRTLTPFFLLPEPRVTSFEEYLKDPARQEKDALALFGNSVFYWVILLVSCGVAGFLLSLKPAAPMPRTQAQENR